MGERTLILGPPGTGKTTTLMGIIRELLSNGYAPDQIGFVSYSKASVGEARDRVVKATGIDSKRWTWFRTLHSCYATLQRFPKDAYLTAADLRQLGRYSLSARDEAAEDGYDVPVADQEAKRDDDMRAAMDWCRSRMVPAYHGVGRLRDRFAGQRYDDFVRDYGELRSRLGKYDHTDILESALRGRIEIPVRVLIVDEAQDLSPLQAACVEVSFPRCDRVYVAGDDDQAIYEFQGSSPDWLISLSRREDWTTRVLGQSWRCPEAVRSRAEKIASRMRNRASKPYAAREGDGLYVTGVSVPDAIDIARRSSGTVLILCRSRKICGQWGGALQRQQVAYAIEAGGSSPFGSNGLRGVIDILRDLYDGNPVPAKRLQWMAASPWAPSSTKADPGVIDRGGKARIKAIAKANPERMIDPHDPDDVADCGLSGPVSTDPWELLASVRKWGDNAGDVRRDLRWIRAVWEESGEAWPTSMPTITTWHRSKGREADLVVIDPSLPYPAAVALTSPHAADPEHRAAYVALTRAKRAAVVVEGDPQAKGRYDFPA